MFIGFCKQGLCILLPFTRPHHLLLTAGIDSKYTSRQHYICIILLVEFSKNLLHAIRPQAHKDPLRRLENWLYSRNNTTELSKQLPPSLGGGLESRSVKFCFLDFLNCPSKAFDALTIIILESLSLRFVPLTYQTHFNLKPDQHQRMLPFNINNCPCGYSLGETINLTLVFSLKAPILQIFEGLQFASSTLPFRRAGFENQPYFGEFLIGPLILKPQIL